GRRARRRAPRAALRPPRRDSIAPMPSLPGDSTAVPPIPAAIRPRGPGDARIVVVHPPELASETPLTAVEVVVGRATKGGFSVPHPTLSRRHLAFRWERAPARRTRVDPGSKHGPGVARDP